ncbi:hypothetical protein CBR_g79128, partial [Chara braunii]
MAAPAQDGEGVQANHLQAGPSQGPRTDWQIMKAVRKAALTRSFVTDPATNLKTADGELILQVEEKMAIAQVTYMRAHIIVMRFEGPLKDLAPQAKLDWIRCWELENWPERGQASYKGRATVEGGALVFYWAPTAALRNWLLREQGSEGIRLGDRTYHVRFTAWKSPVEVEWERLQERKARPWVRFVQPPPTAVLMLRQLAESFFGAVRNPEGTWATDGDGRETIRFDLYPPLRSQGLERLAVAQTYYGRPEGAMLDDVTEVACWEDFEKEFDNVIYTEIATESSLGDVMEVGDRRLLQPAPPHQTPNTNGVGEGRAHRAVAPDQDSNKVAMARVQVGPTERHRGGQDRQKSIKQMVQERQQRQHPLQQASPTPQQVAPSQQQQEPDAALPQAQTEPPPPKHQGQAIAGEVIVLSGDTLPDQTAEREGGGQQEGRSQVVPMECCESAGEQRRHAGERPKTQVDEDGQWTNPQPYDQLGCRATNGARDHELTPGASIGEGVAAGGGAVDGGQVGEQIKSTLPNQHQRSERREEGQGTSKGEGITIRARERLRSKGQESQGTSKGEGAPTRAGERRRSEGQGVRGPQDFDGKWAGMESPPPNHGQRRGDNAEALTRGRHMTGQASKAKGRPKTRRGLTGAGETGPRIRPHQKLTRRTATRVLCYGSTSRGRYSSQKDRRGRR